MTAYRYQAIESCGTASKGVIEAEDRKAALFQLGQRGLFPSSLEACVVETSESTAGSPTLVPSRRPESVRSLALKADGVGGRFRIGAPVKRKEVTLLTREMAALLEAGIPILQALNGLGEEEENPALKRTLESIVDSVRKGTSFSTALEQHPMLFNRLYVSMIRVGEEAGALQRVMTDLADLLEHEDEMRGEVVAAVSYPVFVLTFGVFTVGILMTVVLPRLFSMLEEMVASLPLPTLILLRVSSALNHYWPVFLIVCFGVFAGIKHGLKTPRGARWWDGFKLKLPIMGAVFRAAALSRFARTLGTLVKSGVSLLPALKIVENTIGNFILAELIARVAEETRGGDSLAAPLRKLGVFPKNAIQMISVGEETGRLDEMLLKVANIEERHMRTRTKTLISLLAPALILVVGALVGFIVIALLLPIFRMSQAVR